MSLLTRVTPLWCGLGNTRYQWRRSRRVGQESRRDGARAAAQPSRNGAAVRTGTTDRARSGGGRTRPWYRTGRAARGLTIGVFAATMVAASLAPSLGQSPAAAA